MTSPTPLPRVLRLTADLCLETELGEVDVKGNQLRLASQLEAYLTERGFKVEKITPIGLVTRPPRETGGPNCITGELLVVVYGDPEDVDRVTRAFAPPQNVYPRLWWEVVTNELLAKRKAHLEARAAHTQKMRAKGLGKVQARPQGQSANATAGGYSLPSRPVAPSAPGSYAKALEASGKTVDDLI